MWIACGLGCGSGASGADTIDLSGGQTGAETGPAACAPGAWRDIADGETSRLGFSASEALAGVEGHWQGRWVPADGPSSGASLSLSRGIGSAQVSIGVPLPARADSSDGVPADCSGFNRLRVPLDVALTSEDGQFADVWGQALSFIALSQPPVQETWPIETFAGTFDPASLLLPTEVLADLRLTLRFDADAPGLTLAATARLAEPPMSGEPIDDETTLRSINIGRFEPLTNP
jgi:hypothetical protein